jgi:5-methylcytosine-specific restriction enzyme A
MPETGGHGNPPWERDETLLALDLVLTSWPRIPGKHSAEVQALSNLLRSLPIHVGSRKNDRFRNPDGVAMTLQNLASMHPDRADRAGRHTSHMDRSIWDEFADRPKFVRALAEQIKAGAALLEVGVDSPEGEPPPFEAIEGTVLARVHQLRERHPGFRSLVLDRVRTEHAVVLCEACGAFLGSDSDPAFFAMFEVHHLVPLAVVGTTITRLPDLALLCATCHRLIHAAMRVESRHLLLADFRQWLRTVDSLRSSCRH